MPAPAEVKHLNARQAGVVLVTFVFTTLVHEPASIVTLLVILGLSIALDYWWKRARTAKAGHVQVTH